MKRFLWPLLAAFFMAITPAHAADVLLQWHKGETPFETINGVPYPGGQIFVYDAGTTNLRTTFSDEDGTTANSLTDNAIVLDANGRLSESVYIPTGSWKFVFKDSDDVTIVTEDNIKGAIDTSSFAPTSAKAEIPWIAKATDYAITSSDMGKGIAADPTGSTFVLTLPSAATVGDGKAIAVKHTGTANVVTIKTSASQAIKHFNTARTTWNLTQPNQTIWLASDGAGWHVVSIVEDGLQQIFTVQDDDLTQPPASPTAGAWYIAASPVAGDWSSYSQYDLLQADGQGGWIKITPSDGYIAWIEDEDKLALFHTSQWNTIRNDETVTALGTMVVQTTADYGVAGGSSTTGSWQTRTLNTEVGTTTITGASLSSNKVTLPAGTYYVNGWANLSGVGLVAVRLWNVTDSVTAIDGGSANLVNANNEDGHLPISGVIVTTGEKEFSIQYQTASAGSLGSATSYRYPEVYAQLDIIDLKSLEGEAGSTGAQGLPGADGTDAGWNYVWDTVDVLETDPTSGKIKRSSTTLAGITEIYVSNTDNDTNYILQEISTWDDGDSTVRGKLKIAGTLSDFIIFQITGANVGTLNFQTLIGSVVTAGGTFSDEEGINITFIPTGDKGDTGATGATGAAGTDYGHLYEYDAVDVLETDPGSGQVKFSSATISAITEIYISETVTPSGSIANEIASWDATSAGAVLKISGTSASDFILFSLTPANTDNGDWVTLSGSVLDSSGTFSDQEEIRVNVRVNGDVGNKGNTGDTGATGAAGADGTDPGIRFETDLTDTAMSAPDNLGIKFDVDVSSSFSGITNIAIDADSAETGNPDVSDWIASWDDAGQAGSKGTLVIKQVHTPQNFMLADVTGSVTDNTSWLQVPVNLRASNGTFTDNTTISVQFAPAGEDGADGAGSVSVAFKTFTPTSGDPIVADDAEDTATLTEGSCIGITGTAASDDITIGITADCITVGQIATGGVASAEIQDGTITADDLATDSVGSDEIAASAVGTSEIADGTVAAADMENITSQRIIGRTTAGAGSREQLDISSITEETAPAAGDDLLGMESGGNIRRFDVGNVGIGQQTIWVPANAMTTATTNGAASGSVDSGANGVKLESFDFDDATDETVQFKIQMPKSWNASNLVAQIVWTANTNTGTVVWEVDGSCLGDDDATNVAITPAAANRESDGTSATAYDLLISREISGWSPDNAAAEEWCIYEIGRDADNASDTLSGDALLLGARIHYTTNENTDD